MPMEETQDQDKLKLCNLLQERQALTIRNDALQHEVYQLKKKVEILESQRESLSAERNQYLDDLNGMRNYITEVLTDRVRALEDKQKIKLLLRLSREAGREGRGAEHDED